jgi:hypothetical protein
MKHMTKFSLPMAALLIFGFNVPAHAQFAGQGGGGDQMQQFAPMLEMMKKKLGKKRFARLMQTMGPMMSQMMDGQGSGFGSGFGGGFGGFGSSGLGNFGGGGGFDIGSMASMASMMDIASMAEMFGSGPKHHSAHHKKVRLEQ